MSTEATVTEHLDTARARSAHVKTERARIKKALATGDLSLEDVLMDPSSEVVGMAVIDVIRATRREQRFGPSLWHINGLAVRAGVNLMIPVGKASLRTREWAVMHGGMWARVA